MGCSVVNFYKFASVAEPNKVKELCRDKAQTLGLLGTILIAPEGLNCSLAGSEQDLREFMEFIRNKFDFVEINAKWSHAAKVPFRYLKVKVKRWVIRFAENHDPTIDQIVNGARMSAQEAQILVQNQPLDTIIVDTRNDYETDVGMFKGAVRLPIKTFTEFPDAFLKAFSHQKDKTFLFYCTGGIRCEKVVPWALERGFEKATQLEGGILKYFEEIGLEGYQEGCFVFDDRVSIRDL